MGVTCVVSIMALYPFFLLKDEVTYLIDITAPPGRKHRGSIVLHDDRGAHQHGTRWEVSPRIDRGSMRDGHTARSGKDDRSLREGRGLRVARHLLTALFRLAGNATSLEAHIDHLHT